jgi:hypothetical protein
LKRSTGEIYEEEGSVDGMFIAERTGTWEAPSCSITPTQKFLKACRDLKFPLMIDISEWSEDVHLLKLGEFQKRLDISLAGLWYVLRLAAIK